MLCCLPSLERGEVLPQALAVLVGGEVLAGVLVELVEVLHADLYHLVHCAVLREVAVCEAVLAVIGILAHDLVAERHSAALAEMLDFRERIVHICCFFLLVFLFILLLVSIAKSYRFCRLSADAATIRASENNLQDLRDLTSSSLLLLGIAHASVAMLSTSAAPCRAAARRFTCV